MNGISTINLSSLFFHSDRGFNYLIHTQTGAKFHGEMDGIDCKGIRVSVLELRTITLRYMKGLHVSWFTG